MPGALHLTAAGCSSLSLAALGRRLEELLASVIRQNASLLDLLLEASEGALDILLLSNSNVQSEHLQNSVSRVTRSMRPLSRPVKSLSLRPLRTYHVNCRITKEDNIKFTFYFISLNLFQVGFVIDSKHRSSQPGPNTTSGETRCPRFRLAIFRIHQPTTGLRYIPDPEPGPDATARDDLSCAPGAPASARRASIFSHGTRRHP